MLTCPHCHAINNHPFKPGRQTDCYGCLKKFMAPGTAKPKRTASAEAKLEKVAQKAIGEHLAEIGWLTLRINSVVTKAISGMRITAYHIYGLLRVPEENRPSPNAGFPDLVAFRGHNGFVQALLLEVKATGGSSTPDQVRFRAFASFFGVTVHIVRCVEDVDKLL